MHAVEGAVRGHISIHAPREGCDLIVETTAARAQPISIHAPREGCDKFHRITSIATVRFQSTHPVRGATQADESGGGVYADFNPRTP